MWFYIRMMTISWVDQIANEEVLQRAGTERKIMNTIRKRHAESYEKRRLRRTDTDWTYQWDEK